MSISDAVPAAFRRVHWSFYVAVLAALAYGAWRGYLDATGGLLP